jgi:chlorophyll synthase
VLTVLYSIAGLGIAIVNDFKSIEGDRQMGLMSLPVAFGIEKAKWICVGSIDATQLAVAGRVGALFTIILQSSQITIRRQTRSL